MGYNISIQIVDSLGNVIGGLVSTVSANYTQTVRVVDSTNHVLDQLGAIYSKTTSLTATQVRTLNSSPVTVVPAPSATQMLIASALIISVQPNTLAFSGASGAGSSVTVQLQRTGQNGDVAALFGTTPWLTADQARVIYHLPSASTLLSDGAGLTSALAGKAITLSASGSLGVAGAITGIAVGSNAGLGYAIGDTGSIDVNGAVSDGNAIYKVTTIGAGGAVTGLAVSLAGGGNPGTSYAVSNGVVTSVNTGAGDGNLLVNVSSVGVGDGTLKVTVNYSIVDVS